MKKALNFTQQVIESIIGAAVLTLIILAVMMAMTSCSSTHKNYSGKKTYHMTKKHGRCVGGTCYAF